MLVAIITVNHSLITLKIDLALKFASELLFVLFIVEVPQLGHHHVDVDKEAARHQVFAQAELFDRWSKLSDSDRQLQPTRQSNR